MIAAWTMGKSRKAMTIALGVLAVASCLAPGTSVENAMLVPYEVGGKIGLANQALEKVTEAKYLGIISISGYCAIVQTEDYQQAVVTSKGQEMAMSLPPGHSPALIGDEHYAIPEISQEDPQETRTTIRSALSAQEYVVHGLLLQGGASLEYIHSTNVCNREYARLNCVNYRGEFKFPADNTWRRLYSYDEALGRGVVLDEDFDGRIIDGGGNFVGGFRWHRIAREFGDGLIAGVKDNREGYYDKDGNLAVPVRFHVEGDIHLAPRFNSGVLPCRLLDGVPNVYSGEKAFSAVHWSLVDTTGRVIADKILADRITEFAEGVAALELDGQFYLVKNDGQKLTPDGFDSIQPSVNGYCRAKKGGIDFLISSADGKIFRCEDL